MSGGRPVAVVAVAAAHEAAPFPEFRGEQIDGVDLVLADADLHGCVLHFLGKPFGEDERQLGILPQVVADLDRIVPLLPFGWSGYFG